MKRLLLSLVLALFAAPLCAATVTLNVATCASYTLTGTPPSQTLTCTATVGTDVGISPPPGGNLVITVGLERFDYASSDWARWQFWQSSEFVPLQARLVAQKGWTTDQAYTRINQQINAYQSTIRLQGVKSGTLGHETYQCATGYTAWGTPIWTPDTAAACDAYIARTQPNALPLGALK